MLVFIIVKRINLNNIENLDIYAVFYNKYYLIASYLLWKPTIAEPVKKYKKTWWSV